MEGFALGVGEETMVRLVGGANLNNASGYFRYLDSNGDEWQTHFIFSGLVGLVVGPIFG